MTEEKYEIVETKVDKDILDFLKAIYFGDFTEIREQEKEIEDKVNKKDTEKREFNWKLVGGISMAVLTVAGISASVLGGKFDIKLPKKS